MNSMKQYEQYEKRFWCSIYNKGWIPVLFSEHVFFQLQVLQPIENSTLLSFFQENLYCFLHSIRYIGIGRFSPEVTCFFFFSNGQKLMRGPESIQRARIILLDYILPLRGEYHDNGYGQALVWRLRWTCPSALNGETGRLIFMYGEISCSVLTQKAVSKPVCGKYRFQ